jgi:ketosteroid isomerase-like protein
MSTENKAVVQRFYDAALSGDIPAMLAIIDPTVRLIEADSLPYGGTAVGHEGVLRVFNSVFSTWKDCRIEVGTLLADGDRVVALAQISGAGTVTGTPFTMSLAEVFRVAGGKIVEIKPFYFDTDRLCEVHGR